MALSGRHLKVATGLWVPWVDLHNHPNGSFSAFGIAVTFLDIIANKLNFTYTLVKPDDMEWGRELPNGSFTGMIGMCERKEVDVALGPFAVTYKRSQAAEFSTSLYVESWGIFLPRPRLTGDLAGFLKPFAWQVWVVLAGMTLLTTALGSVLNWLTSKGSSETPGGDDEVGSRDEHHPGKSRPFRSSWIIRAIVNEGKRLLERSLFTNALLSYWCFISPAAIKVLPRDATGRVFVGTWLVAAFILGSAYQGVLTSLLTVPLVTVPVNSLEDLVHYGRIPWAIEVGTLLQQVFADAESGVYRKIFESASYVLSSWDAKLRIKKGELAVFADNFSMRKIMHDDYGRTGKCHYYIAKDIIRSAPLAFAFPKRSQLAPLFNNWMAPLKESGLVSRSLLELTSNATACLVPPGREGGLVSSLVLTLSDLAGVFLLFTGGLALATAVFVVERCVRSLAGCMRKP
ncbi:glutamate receptor ionotropic, kainate glr-3-like [Panulirus ornatus]|uniref:glutamate receptor ionotropic, kainate glr-3-like n=1 Tax=Panulirus ornatus TaxID=150431 RepID=UPI003A85BBFB